MFGKLIIAAAAIAAPTVVVAAEWFVVRSPDRTCFVANQVVRGYGKLAGPFGSQAQANAKKERIPACDKVNTNPSTTGGPAR